MHRFLFLFILGVLLNHFATAQDTLPNVTVTQLGRKVLVSWQNPFTSITNINIQRSGDSIRNFTTIGSVLNVNSKSNGFVDTKEFLPSNQYYRLFISFEGGTYIFTDSHRPGPDTMNISVDVVDTREPVQTWFVPSSHIYTGAGNNVIISLSNVAKHQYSIKFFETDGTFLFEVNRIPQNYLIMDKVNFGHSGLFNFELYDNRILIERHKIYIPRDGEQMPSLDVNGNHIN